MTNIKNKENRLNKRQLNIDIIFLIIAFIVVFVAMFIITSSAKKRHVGDDKITIVATLFPQYDFARIVAGDHANVVLLLPPGMESHSFDLRPFDMITIKESDMFIYTGKYMEPWAESIIDSVEEKVMIVDASAGIELVKETDYGIGEHEHHHDEDDHEADEHGDDNHDADDNDAHNHGGHGHSHEYDPHIWTSPVYAMTMVNNIRDALCELDPDNSDDYISNASSYIAELTRLDEAFREVSASVNDHTLFFGGRFAMTYFAREYGFDCIAAYHDCSAESEPSIAKVVLLINEIREHNAKAIFYEELVDPKVARTIAEETDIKLILLHSAHNLSRDEFKEGKTYLDIMWDNVDAIKEGLN